jgi:hypothetical protein
MAFVQQNNNLSHVGNFSSKLAETSWCTSVLPDEYVENTFKEITIASDPVFSSSRMQSSAHKNPKFIQHG